MREQLAPKIPIEITQDTLKKNPIRAQPKYLDLYFEEVK